MTYDTRFSVTLQARRFGRPEALRSRGSNGVEYFRVQAMLRAGLLKEGDTLEHHGEIFRQALRDVVTLVWSDPLTSHDWSREEWLTGDAREFLSAQFKSDTRTLF